MAANGKKTPFSLIRKNTVLVKPTSPTPSETLSLSSIDNNPNIELMCQSIYVYRSNDLSVSDPVLVLKQGLARALDFYHPLAGKLKRQPDRTLRITCNADGVPFCEATVGIALDSLNYFDGIDAETAQTFLLDYPSDSDQHGYHPLVLQVTKFSCGGFTVGMRLSHSVCDGFGAAQFYRAMSELASGMSEPTVKPVWERERLVGIAGEGEGFEFFEMGSFTKSPLLPASELCHRCFYVDAESIKRLKILSTDEAAGDETTDTSFTTIEVLGAYVWRARFRALKQDPNGQTILHLALGIRHLVNPPLPEGYYGNAFVSASVVLPGKDLDNWPLFKVSRLIKQSKKSASEADHIMKTLNFLEAFRQRDMKVEDYGASLVVTDWRQLKLSDEVDFGWGEAVNMVPIPCNMPEFLSLCVFWPPNKITPSMEGGIRVLVSLPGDAMNVFEQEMDALKNQS